MAPNRESILAESWQRTLAGIPTYAGRLAYLASLRNIHSGAYEHFGLAQRIGEKDVDRLLRRSHVEIFQEWLCFGLERQKSELEDLYLPFKPRRRTKATIAREKAHFIANTLMEATQWIIQVSSDIPIPKTHEME